MNRPALSNISNTSKHQALAIGQRKKNYRTGRWEKYERIAFLRGFRIHGKGHWKKIADMIPYRTTIQVKTHAQHIMRLIDNGGNPFAELDDYYATNAAALSKYDYYATNAVALSKHPQRKRKNSKNTPELAAACILLSMKESK